MSVLETLTEGIKERSLQQEGAALLEKWDKTGLLEGLGSDYKKNNMARLLENQASQLLKEASSMSAGDVQGFASVAFPIVRRVFGGLIANDLVSVQPMSLPSGLIFFMDFTFNANRLGSGTGSLYGGGVVASQLTGGVNLSGLEQSSQGFYSLNSGYASPTGSITGLSNPRVILTGTVGKGFQAGAVTLSGVTPITYPVTLTARYDNVVIENPKDLFDFITHDDPDLSGTVVAICESQGAVLTQFDQLNLDNLISISGSTPKNPMIRRLTQFSPVTDDRLVFVVAATASSDTAAEVLTSASALMSAYKFAISDDFGGSAPIGAVAATTLWGLEGAGGGSQGVQNTGLVNADIPEIDIKVDSVAVTAVTKKLKAKWTPELGQDLNAYHNLDAEVELTQILSEQIALEIDREIVNDLVQGAKAGRYFWSRSPGLFVDKETGVEIGASTQAPDFTGNVSEWYETLVETINDVSAQIHRKTLRGGANFIVCGPEVANILEFTAGFRANVSGESDRGTVGSVKTGSLSKKWDVYVDPYFPRNIVLVGRKGGSFLESGYVYAPYVPLQVTPTIFGTEDFVPRKGVMTRYAKKMVRPDMYGLVIVTGLLGQTGT